MAEALPVCTSTIKLAILKEFTTVPPDRRPEAIKLAAQVMAENSNQPLPPDDEQSFLDVIARPIPRPFTLGSKLPIEVRNILREASLLFAPHAATAAVEVATAEERDDRERNTTLPGNIKVPRTVPPPWNVFYPHMWMGRTFEEWARNWTVLITGHPVPDVHVLKLRRCEAALSSWFAIFANQPLQEHSVIIFLSLADVLAEVFLLLKYSGPRPSVATLTFAAAIENRRQTGKVLDYFTDINSARAAIEIPKNGLFRI